MGKIKEHYYQKLEALSKAQLADNECHCAGPISSIEELCPPCQQEYEETVVAQDIPIPAEAIDQMAAELEHLDGEAFWSKMMEIEDYWEEHYLPEAA